MSQVEDPPAWRDVFARHEKTLDTTPEELWDNKMSANLSKLWEVRTWSNGDFDAFNDALSFVCGVQVLFAEQFMAG